MVTLIFISDTRSGQVQVKKVKFETQKIFSKHTYLVQFLSQDSKNIICFDVRQLEMPKIEVKTGHCIARNKDIDIYIYRYFLY